MNLNQAKPLIQSSRKKISETSAILDRLKYRVKELDDHHQDLKVRQLNPNDKQQKNKQNQTGNSNSNRPNSVGQPGNIESRNSDKIFGEYFAKIKTIENQIQQLDHQLNNRLTFNQQKITRSTSSYNLYPPSFIQSRTYQPKVNYQSRLKMADNYIYRGVSRSPRRRSSPLGRMWGPLIMRPYF